MRRNRWALLMLLMGATSLGFVLQACTMVKPERSEAPVVYSSPTTIGRPDQERTFWGDIWD